MPDLIRARHAAGIFEEDPMREYVPCAVCRNFKHPDDLNKHDTEDAAGNHEIMLICDKCMAEMERPQ